VRKSPFFRISRQHVPPSPGASGGHAGGGEFPQLVVDERQEVGSSLAVACRGSIEEAGHIGHDG
jgi:hypothetical protein